MGDKLNYDMAQQLYQRALLIQENTLGNEHPAVAYSLYGLAKIFHTQLNWDQAELLYQRALAIQEKTLGDEHPAVVLSLSSLAELYRDQGRDQEAKPILLRLGQNTADKLKEVDDPTVEQFAIELEKLVQNPSGNTEIVENLFQNVITIIERNEEEQEHPLVNLILSRAADIYLSQGNHEAAGLLYERSIAFHEEKLGLEHPFVANNITGLAALYVAQEKYSEAEQLYRRALKIYEKQFGPKHSAISDVLYGLETLYRKTGKIELATDLLTRANDIEERTLSLIIAYGSETRKRAFMSTLSGTTDATISLHIQNALDSPQAAELALTTILRRKGRVLDVLTDSIQSLRQNLSPDDQVLLDQFNALRSELATLTFKDIQDNSGEQDFTSVASLQTQVEALENTLARRSAESGTNLNLLR